MVRAYEIEKGIYEYVDDEGYKRVGRWEQKYVGDRDYYSPGDRLMNRKKVGMVDFYNDTYDEYVDGVPDKRRECPHCLQYGVHNKLSGRILKKGEKKPVDYDQFLQCVSGCGNLFPVHEIERQKKLEVNELKGHIVENPFEANQTLIESIPKRSSPAGKNAARGRKRKKTILHEDPEINELMRIYGDRVNVVYDTNP